MTEVKTKTKGAEPEAASLESEAARQPITAAAVDKAHAEALASAAAKAPDVAPPRPTGIPGWPECTEWAELVYRGGLPQRKDNKAYGSVPDPLDGSGNRLAVAYSYGNVMRGIEHEGQFYNLTDANGTMYLGQGVRVRLPVLLAFHLVATISAAPNHTVGPQYTNEKNGRIVTPSQCIDIFIAPELLPKALQACGARYGTLQGSMWTRALKHMTIRSIDDGTILHQGEGVSLNAAGIATTAEVESLKAQVAQLLALQAGK